MGSPPGRRYESKPGFGTYQPIPTYIAELSYKDACLQYLKDKTEDKKFEDESKANFGLATVPLTIFGKFASLIGLSTMLGEEVTIPKDDLSNLSKNEIKSNWDLLVDHFGKGVIEPPKEVLELGLRGYKGDPTLLDSDKDGYLDKSVETEIRKADGSTEIISPDPDEPDILISPVTVHDTQQSKPETQIHYADGSVKILSRDPDEPDVFFSPVTVHNTQQSEDEPDMVFEPDVVYRSDDPRNLIPDVAEPDNEQDDFDDLPPDVGVAP